MFYERTPSQACQQALNEYTVSYSVIFIETVTSGKIWIHQLAERTKAIL